MASSSASSPPTTVLPQPPDTAPAAPTKDLGNNFTMLTMLLPKLPLIVRVAVLHVLRLSEPAKYLDLRSALIISVLRSFLEPEPSKPRSISSIQKMTLKDPGIKGRIWISTYTAPFPPEFSARDALMQALKDMSQTTTSPPGQTPEYRVPDAAPVQAEWTGYRASASSQDPLPPITDREMYDEMMREVTQPTTVLYLHGGAYYLCDPVTHRPTTKRLAKLTGGRCYSVRYRLAPQHPFPAALLDALVSYLALLYPPPGAYHEAVRPEHLVLAGDRYVSVFP